MQEKIVLIGAGSAMFTVGLVADVLRHGWAGELALVDIDPQALDVAERLVRKMLVKRKSTLGLSAATDRRAALPGATAVICTVGVGGRRAWEQDVFIPRRHGIFQPVGDSVMPGGSSRALRMIPAMVAIARDVLDLAPQALFFNYGNPMGPVCRAVRKATGANVVGLCHGVFDVARHIAGELGVPAARLKYAAVGMNHLTWFTEVRVDGQDMLPRLRALARERLGQDPKRQHTPNPFTCELVDLFGAFPAVLDRHITEFFPHLFSREGSYYGKTLGVAGSEGEPGPDTFSFEGTIAWGDRIFAEMRERALSPDPLPDTYLASVSGEHEQVTNIIASIRQDTGEVYSANLPNRGQVPNLPADVVIECPAVADAAGLKPIVQPPLSPGLAGTLATRFQWVETIAEAALTGSRELFVQALLIDGAVPSVQAAQALADDLLQAHAAYLPQFQACA